LSDFQQGWLAWGAVSIFIGVLVMVLAIRLVDPVIRFLRLELRFLGKRQETILNARREGLDSEIVHQAMAQRAEIEAHELAARILGGQNKLQPHTIKGFSDGGSTFPANPDRKQIKAADGGESSASTKRFDSH